MFLLDFLWNLDFLKANLKHSLNIPKIIILPPKVFPSIVLTHE